MKLLEAKRIHFIGIGGIGTSAIAQILLEKGKKISGSDSVPSAITKSLKNRGAKVFYEHKASNLNKSTDLVVYSPAIPNDNPELKKAKGFKIKTITYPQALGQLTQEYYTIAIAGSHGKSTTTAMTAIMLEKAGLDPTVVIGTKIREFGNKNYRVGKSNYLVIEACEYKDSFLNFSPNILMITNVDLDHMDYFKTYKAYLASFNVLAKQVAAEGSIIVNMDEKDLSNVAKGAKAKVFGISKTKKADFKLKGDLLIYRHPLTNTSKKSEHNFSIKPGVSGEFNVKNAALVAVCGKLLNIPNNKIVQALKAFHGSWRRLEEKKVKLRGVKFIDDYAHHPTEIVATLSTIRALYPKAKILCVFQPHQHNRTKHFLKEFGKSFKNMNEVIVPNIYKVRDSAKDVASVSTDDLVAEIKKNKIKASNGGGLKTTAEFLKKHYKNYDLIVTMGAGDVDGIYRLL